MARARNIKPGFYANEDLAECSIWARFIFPGLWMMADREGRLEYRPKKIKGELLRYDSQDAEPLLRELEKHGFISIYEVEGKEYIQIVKFSLHQNPHHREAESVIPSPQSLGLYGVDNPPKPRATAPCNGCDSPGKPKNEDQGHDLPGGSSRADSGFLIPDSLKAEPIGSGADAPPELSSAEALYQVAVPWLVSRDVADKTARSLLGGARKQLGDDAAWALASECIRVAPLEPVPWLAAAINARIGRRPPRASGQMLDNAAENARAAEMLFGPDHPLEAIDG